MNKETIQISSVKLIDGGLKGLKIKYLITGDDSEGRSYNKTRTEENHRPVVGTELLVKFDEFQKYFEEICSVETGRSIITGITAGFDNFIIHGKVDCLEDKVAPLSTPKTREEDNYGAWVEVQAKVDELYKMVSDYMELGSYSANDLDIVLAANKGKEGFDAEAVKLMTEEELTILSTQHLEKIGCIVMNPHEEDMPGGIDSEEVELKDISAGDEKETMFDEEDKDMPPTEVVVEEKKVVEGKIIDIEKNRIDAKRKEKESAEIADKKQKAREQLAQLKEAQAKLEKVVDEDDDFVVPTRKVM